MITENTLIGDMLDSHPFLQKILMQAGMHCFGCPAARGESLGEACLVHGVNCDELLEKLNSAIQS